VAASDPQLDVARRMFRSRLINVLVGSACGFFFLLLGGKNHWMLPLALAATVVVSTWVVRVKTMWRQGPITAAVVVAAGVAHQSTGAGLGQGLHKVAEVVFGCLVGLFVSWLMARVWLIQVPAGEDAAV